LAQQVVPGWRSKSFPAGVASRFELASADRSLLPNINRLYTCPSRSPLLSAVLPSCRSDTQYNRLAPFPLIYLVLCNSPIRVLQGALLVKGNEQINPLFGTTEPNDLDPRPVLATGLLSSFVSREWAAESEAVTTPIQQKQFHDSCTQTTINLYGIVDVQADDDPTFLAFIADIKTSLVLGINYFEETDVKLIFPETTISKQR
jgi:hypothetical protein